MRDGGSEGCAGGPEQVKALLKAELAERLREVLPAFVVAAAALREALELAPAAPMMS